MRTKSEGAKVGIGASECVAAQPPKFDELTPAQQIQKLHYELANALHCIFSLETRIGRFPDHTHDPHTGQPVIALTKIRGGGVNRQQFLD